MGVETIRGYDTTRAEKLRAVTAVLRTIPDRAAQREVLDMLFAEARKRGARQLQPCGTTAAYQRHLNRSEEPCRPCRDATAADRQGRRKAGPVGRPEPQPCGTFGAYKRHRKNGQEPCQACRQAYVDYWRLRRAARAADGA